MSVPEVPDAFVNTSPENLLQGGSKIAFPVLE